jgi:hypothetical protein
MRSYNDSLIKDLGLRTDNYWVENPTFERKWTTSTGSSAMMDKDYYNGEFDPGSG